MALTNPASLSTANLAADSTFQMRVKFRLWTAIQNVYSNNGANITPDGVLLYNRRRQFAVFIEQTFNGGTPNWPFIMAQGVATDTTVLSDATSGLTIDVTPGNAEAQGLLVTDAHIDNAIASQFNSYLQAT